MLDHWSLTSAALHGEPWRLWTGHLAHWGLRHLLVDAAAAVPPLLLLRARDRRSYVLWAIVAAPLISLGILVTTPDVLYRGISAIVVGLWVLVPLRERGAQGAILLGLCVAKLAIETATPVRLGVAEAAPLPVAHLLGALSGAASYVVWRRQGQQLDRCSVTDPPIRSIWVNMDAKIAQMPPS
ncbi:MAG: rrtA [Acidobacteria bacterium]|nr:rrtA [Acidobacteriota bacterium]